jgi:prepilin-type N-terminal cleavage/methylation domain-containing protein/prepilin-type processing-associated H-X9-DG protein
VNVFEVIGRSDRNRRQGKKCAFNLIELLVVIAIIAIVAALSLSTLARAKQKRLQADCLSQLKQLGHALQMYIDDNEDQLPGPLWSGMQASADANSSEQFLFYAASYLGIPPLSNQTAVIPVAACPGYMRAAPGISSLSDMEGRISYLLNPDVDPLPGPPLRPFGYPDPLQPPLKRSQLTRHGTLAELYAISDVDKGNVTDPSVGWWNDLPYAPVHGGVRNKVFFDGHVTAVRASTDAAPK